MYRNMLNFYENHVKHKKIGPNEKKYNKVNLIEISAIHNILFM